MAMATGDDDGEEDGEGDGDCPSGPTYLPTPAEACEDFASVPTTEFDDFCTSPELTDCCATNAVAAVVSVRRLRLRPPRVSRRRSLALGEASAV